MRPETGSVPGTIYLSFYEEAKGKNREAEYRLSRALLKRGLEDLYGISGEEALELTRGKHGKPYLSRWPQIHFNISHCRGLAGCAFGERELGLDVERIRPFKERLAVRLLSPKEQELLARAKNPEAMFFRFWTLKESYGKARGTGLAYPLHEAEFFPAEAESMAFDSMGCCFYQKQLKEEFFLAVCIKQQSAACGEKARNKKAEEWRIIIL